MVEAQAAASLASKPTKVASADGPSATTIRRALQSLRQVPGSSPGTRPTTSARKTPNLLASGTSTPRYPSCRSPSIMTSGRGGEAGADCADALDPGLEDL